MKPTFWLATATCAVALLRPSTAEACGGCFHPEDQPPEQASVVVAHRMALAVSPRETVLWDQVQYAGSPAEFAWLLPVRPGARIELGTDAWFEALDAATGVRVTAPLVRCATTSTQSVDEGVHDGRMHCQMAPAMAAGCSADEGALSGAVTEEVIDIVDLPPEKPPVEVVHHGSVGPYETVTLRSEESEEVTTWLSDHGFAIDELMAPVLEGYVEEGFDFIALRLLPAVGVQQMRPVRVVQPGAVTTLPLRMVAAGTGPEVAMTLFVIGEGRWTTESFPSADAPSDLTWDFADNRSDYAEKRALELADDGGRGWLTTFAQRGALLSPQVNPRDGVATRILAGSAWHTTVADAYFAQALSNGETTESCVGQVGQYADHDEVVRDGCVEVGPTEPGLDPSTPPTGCLVSDAPSVETEAFRCGDADDLAVAIDGKHPRDVWVTRLEANLPRDTLDRDLVLGASLSQLSVSNWVEAEGHENAPCEVVEGELAQASRRRPAIPAATWIGVLAAGAALVRRLARRRR